MTSIFNVILIYGSRFAKPRALRGSGLKMYWFMHKWSQRDGDPDSLERNINVEF